MRKNLSVPVMVEQNTSSKAISVEVRGIRSLGRPGQEIAFSLDACDLRADNGKTKRRKRWVHTQLLEAYDQQGPPANAHEI